MTSKDRAMASAVIRSVVLGWAGSRPAAVMPCRTSTQLGLCSGEQRQPHGPLGQYALQLQGCLGPDRALGGR